MERTEGKLISISSVVGMEKITSQADTIGIVFPVFYATNDCGIPLIISRFVQKLEGLNSKYVFAVCTSGNMPGTTLENLAKLIASKDGTLASGFIIKMKDENLSKEKQERMLADQKEKLDAVSKYVLARKKGKVETRGPSQDTPCSGTLPCDKTFVFEKIPQAFRLEKFAFF